MKEFKNKVAVVTGAASGIGWALANHCVREGMKVVLADIERPALAQAEHEMKAVGANVLAVPTDVSKARDVETPAHKTLDAYGAVHLLFNNAGVFENTSIEDTPVWESTVSDWEWVLGVNLWGVIHGVRTFVPIMLGHRTHGHIVNTASTAGLISCHGIGIYKVAKHAVVTLSETLYHELGQRKANVKVSVLCPGFVKTRLVGAARNRPVALQNSPAMEPLSPEAERRRQAWTEAVQKGLSPQQVAECVFQAIRDDKFYILTHPESTSLVQLRMEDILEGRNPTDALAGTGL